MTPAGGGETKSIVQTRADERAPIVSPDDRWLAYLSDETGRYELYRCGVIPAVATASAFQ